MLAKATKNRSEREYKKPINKHKLQSYNHNSEKIKETVISLDNKYISDLSFSLMAGEIIPGGFFSNKNRVDLAGTFYFNVDKNTQLFTSERMHDFSNEFMSEFMLERRAKKKNNFLN